MTPTTTDLQEELYWLKKQIDAVFGGGFTQLHPELLAACIHREALGRLGDKIGDVDVSSLCGPLEQIAKSIVGLGDAVADLSPIPETIGQAISEVAEAIVDAGLSPADRLHKDQHT